MDFGMFGDMANRCRMGQALTPGEQGFLHALELNLLNLLLMAVEAAGTFVAQYLQGHGLDLTAVPWQFLLVQASLVFLLSFLSSLLRTARASYQVAVNAAPVIGMAVSPQQLDTAQAAVDAQLQKVVDGSKGGMPTLATPSLYDTPTQQYQAVKP